MFPGDTSKLFSVAGGPTGSNTIKQFTPANTVTGAAATLTSVTPVPAFLQPVSMCAAVTVPVSFFNSAKISNCNGV
jgi:hypothetical protein